MSLCAADRLIRKFRVTNKIYFPTKQCNVSYSKRSQKDEMPLWRVVDALNVNLNVFNEEGANGYHKITFTPRTTPSRSLDIHGAGDHYNAIVVSNNNMDRETCGSSIAGTHQVL